MAPYVILIKKSITILFGKKTLNPVFKKAQDMKFMHIEFFSSTKNKYDTLLGNTFEL